MLTYEQAREYFNYNQETGVLTWKITKSSGACKGYRVGMISDRGYLITCINKKMYRVSRIIWLYVYGVWPTHYIDHINGIRDDNRLCNLREVTPRENQQNSKAHRNGKLVGFRKHKNTSKVSACIGVSNKKIHLGMFNTEQEAHETYLEACAKLARGEKVEGVKPRGYSFDKKTGKHRVQIKLKGYVINVGFFNSPELALKARTEVIKQIKLGVPLWDYMPKKISYNPEIDKWIVKGEAFSVLPEAFKLFDLLA